MQQHTIKVSLDQARRRLDSFVAEFSKDNSLGISRTSIQKLIRDGNISIKNLASLKPHYLLKPGDQITIKFENKKYDLPKGENIPLDIVYEDDYLAVINKPCGIVVHPAPGNYAHTLVNALVKHFKNLSDINPQRPGIVHRLDKETSGLLVIAKDNATHLGLAEQFSEHSISRKYIALVKGMVEFDEDVIEMPIGRHPYKRKNMAVGFTKNTKYAKTHYRTLRRTDEFSLLELKPFTGRTHQLRVHLAFLGHPILGDTKYGKNNQFKRLALHAQYIGFVHPKTNKLLEFSCDIPNEFREFLKVK